jgi:beta-lysine 5,6-aminomutase alpha subunit
VETLAGSWGARARNSTTIGRERAILRLFGVHGLDRDGRPLAGEVVDRYLAGGPGRLGGGIALPFAMGLLEYDLAPQQLALDVASGAVDLGLEAELLGESDRRAVAEVEATRLAAAAFERIDANRTARRELLDVLGDAPRPWVGSTVIAPVAEAAVGEAVRLARDGIDLVRVDVPVGRELAARLTSAGMEVAGWEPPDGAAEQERDIAPSGSQRGLAALRLALDEAAAERRAYARLATASPPLAAPEQAVVASFERIDLVEADPMAEIVAGRVDPDRALADHAFAHRLHARAGTLVLLGAGPLVVGPDLASGIPSDSATRAGRALALQLVGAAIARGNGLASAQLVVGALPDWLTDERAPAARAAAEVAIRRALLPGHPLAFDEPATVPERAALWPFILAAVLVPGGDTALIVRRPRDGAMRPAVLATRAAASVAAEIGSSRAAESLAGAALDHARATVAAATVTLERVADLGWRAVLGDPPGGAGPRLGADALAERTETFDPLTAAAEAQP